MRCPSAELPCVERKPCLLCGWEGPAGWCSRGHSRQSRFLSWNALYKAFFLTLGLCSPHPSFFFLFWSLTLENMSLKYLSLPLWDLCQSFLKSHLPVLQPRTAFLQDLGAIPLEGDPQRREHTTSQSPGREGVQPRWAQLANTDGVSREKLVQTQECWRQCPGHSRRPSSPGTLQDSGTRSVQCRKPSYVLFHRGAFNPSLFYSQSLSFIVVLPKVFLACELV